MAWFLTKSTAEVKSIDEDDNVKLQSGTVVDKVPVSSMPCQSASVGDTVDCVVVDDGQEIIIQPLGGRQQ